MVSNEIIRIAVSGFCGRMGRSIAGLILQDKELFLAGAIERQGHQDLGKDAGEFLGTERLGVKIKSDVCGVLENSDVLIEFTSPEATLKHLKDCVAMKKPMVIGVTSLSEADERKIKAASEKIAIVKSSNMSLGVNLLFNMLSKSAKKMGEHYDIEIVEAHHNQKKDAPSGTALSMAKIICEAIGLDAKKALCFGRRGITGARPKKEIGIHAVRAGEIVGDHSVIFAGKGECIEIKHHAQSRDAFAKGAVLAAKFLSSKKKGLYDMRDVLGI